MELAGALKDPAMRKQMIDFALSTQSQAIWLPSLVRGLGAALSVEGIRGGDRGGLRDLTFGLTTLASQLEEKNDLTTEDYHLLARSMEWLTNEYKKR